MSPVQWIISVDRSLLGFKDKLRQMFGEDIPTDAELMNANVLRLPSFTRHGGLADFSTLMQEAESIPHVDQFTRDDSYEMLILQATLMLLNCRNVITVNHQAPERLNAKRCRNGKQALFPYRTIRIVVPRKRYLPSQAPKPRDSLSKSVHLCRGHFKDYKEMHLFSASMRGCTGGNLKCVELDRSLNQRITSSYTKRGRPLDKIGLYQVARRAICGAHQGGISNGIPP